MQYFLAITTNLKGTAKRFEIIDSEDNVVDEFKASQYFMAQAVCNQLNLQSIITDEILIDSTGVVECTVVETSEQLPTDGSLVAAERTSDRPESISDFMEGAVLELIKSNERFETGLYRLGQHIDNSVQRLSDSQDRLSDSQDRLSDSQDRLSDSQKRTREALRRKGISIEGINCSLPSDSSTEPDVESDDIGY